MTEVGWNWYDAPDVVTAALIERERPGYNDWWYHRHQYLKAKDDGDYHFRGMLSATTYQCPPDDYEAAKILGKTLSTKPRFDWVTFVLDVLLGITVAIIPTAVVGSADTLAGCLSGLIIVLGFLLIQARAHWVK